MRQHAPNGGVREVEQRGAGGRAHKPLGGAAAAERARGLAGEARRLPRALRQRRIDRALGGATQGAA
jgi:hypothetical protein